MIILVRELITQILLSTIGFCGRYRGFVGGLHDRELTYKGCGGAAILARASRGGEAE